MLWIMDHPAMHHGGCMALHHMVQGMAALNLILNYVEFGTNYALNVVHGMVQGEI